MTNRADDGPGFDGEVIVPQTPVGVVLLLEEEGRESTRRRTSALVDWLSDAGYATCTIMLPQRRQMALVSNSERQAVDALIERTTAAARAIKNEGDLAGLRLGLFASGPGGAAAMIVAASQPDLVDAVVMSDGRADLAGVRLHRVTAPSLFIVAAGDHELIELNRWSQRRLGGVTQLDLVPLIKHDIPGVSELDLLAKRAGRWFDNHLAVRGANPRRRSLFGVPLPFARAGAQSIAVSQ